MGIVLYRPGRTSTVNGIKCEMKVFDEYFYLDKLDLGWFYTPEECYPDPVIPEKPEPEKKLDPIQPETRPVKKRRRRKKETE